MPGAVGVNSVAPSSTDHHAEHAPKWSAPSDQLFRSGCNGRAQILIMPGWFVSSLRAKAKRGLLLRNEMVSSQEGQLVLKVSLKEGHIGSMLSP